MDKQEGWEAAGGSTTPQPALVLLNSAPKSPLLAFVSSCHLFLWCIACIFFPEVVNFPPVLPLTSKTTYRKKGEQSLTERPNGKA